MRAAMMRRRRRLPDPSDPTFITTWETTTAAESITLPLISSGTYDFEVDWGDGNTDTITAFDDAARIHEYAEAGVRDVRISGVCEGWNFFDVSTSKDNILDVNNWGSLRLHPRSTRAFQACANFTVTATDAPDLTGATDLSVMFLGSASFNGTIGAWDVSSVESLFTIFRNTPFNQPIGDWDVSSVADMRDVFRSTPFSQPIGDWDVSSVADMGSMFRDGVFNQPIGGWDVSSVTNMGSMFLLNPEFNQPIGDWDVSSVTDMNRVFISASAFNQDIGAWPLRRAGVNMEFALQNCGMTPENYSRTLIGWANYVASSPGGPFNVDLGAGTLTYNDTVYEPGATYTNAVDARAYLTGLVAEGGAGWTITDGGLAT